VDKLGQVVLGLTQNRVPSQRQGTRKLELVIVDVLAEPGEARHRNRRMAGEISFVEGPRAGMTHHDVGPGETLGKRLAGNEIFSGQVAESIAASPSLNE
jgi:hypothetical protein